MACPEDKLVNKTHKQHQFILLDAFADWEADILMDSKQPVTYTRNRGRLPSWLLQSPDGKARIYARPYQHGGLLGHLWPGAAMDPERGLRELFLHQAAYKDKLPVPQPVGLWLDKSPGRFPRWHFLTIWVAQYTPVSGIMQSGEGLSDNLIKTACRGIRAIHDWGLYHHDLNLHNLIAKEQTPEHWSVLCIDFDRSIRTQPLSMEQRMRNLERLHRSLEKMLGSDIAGATYMRMRFIRTYTQGDPVMKQRLKTCLRKPSLHYRRHQIGWRLGLG